MKRWLAIALLALAASACTDVEGATHALRAEGFKNVVTTGYSWGCGKDDGTCTGFEATGPSGERVEGAVGCGFWMWSKGCTVRIGR